MSKPTIPSLATDWWTMNDRESGTPTNNRQSESGSRKARVTVSPTHRPMRAEEIEMLLWRLNNSSPDGASAILRGNPRWLTMGSFVLACIIILSGIAYSITSGRVSGLVLATFGLPIISLIFRTSRGSPLNSLFDSYANQIRQRVGEEVDSEEQDVFREDEVSRRRELTFASEALQKQEAILREIYTQGLTQAKLTFIISVFFMILGAVVLLIGVALAVFNAPTNGEKYSSIVAGTAGVVINLTSSVFIVQSNRARKSMGERGVMLREESQEDRRLSAAREVAAAISDIALRDKVQAEMSILLLRRGEAGTVDPVEPTKDSSLKAHVDENKVEA